jgi:hypothetical protein
MKDKHDYKLISEAYASIYKENTDEDYGTKVANAVVRCEDNYDSLGDDPTCFIILPEDNNSDIYTNYGFEDLMLHMPYEFVDTGKPGPDADEAKLTIEDAIAKGVFKTKDITLVDDPLSFFNSIASGKLTILACTEILYKQSGGPRFVVGSGGLTLFIGGPNAAKAGRAYYKNWLDEMS